MNGVNITDVTGNDTPASIVLEMARNMYPNQVWLILGDGKGTTDIASNLANPAETLRFIEHARDIIASNPMERKTPPKL